MKAAARAAPGSFELPADRFSNRELNLQLSDDTLAWELRGDGSWRKVPAERGVDSQRAMQKAMVEVLFMREEESA